MDRYTIYCTEEQAKKALVLGAPIIVTPEEYKEDAMHFQMYLNGENASIVLPTAEQMIGWLEEQGIYIHAEAVARWWRYYVTNSIEYIRCGSESSRKKATLAAIDAALEYLSRNKKEE